MMTKYKNNGDKEFEKYSNKINYGGGILVLQMLISERNRGRT